MSKVQEKKEEKMKNFNHLHLSVVVAKIPFCFVVIFAVVVVVFYLLFMAVAAAAVRYSGRHE